MAVLVGAWVASITYATALAETGKRRHKSEYAMYWLNNYNPMGSLQQPHISQLVKRGLKRGLTSF